MKLTRVVIVCALWVGLGVGRAAATDGNPGIVPIAGPVGHAIYGTLAAKWWQWAAETPAPESALLDTTGANCASHQGREVWFLAGTLDGSPVTRSCAVPRGTYLFFPLANDFYGAFTTDPAAHKTVPYLRSQVTCIADAVVSATIDGVPVNDPQQYLELSIPFAIHLPEDNIFGVTAADVPHLLLAPAVDEGYYLYLKPLAPGAHTIHFTAESCGGPQDVTYTLTVD
ncbi:MAG TPA: hypothetical protein VHL80_14365 [Polyangia bacterium]|nr:hypothetical protein [Polyangia bacterium]